MIEKQSAFFYGPAGGRPVTFYHVYAGQPVPDSLSLRLCGEVIEANEDPRPLYRIDPATGKHRPATPDEIEAAKAAQDQEHLEIKIEDAQARTEAATKAGLAERAAKHQARLAELKAELANRDD